jgi:hypothetical protein
MTPQEIWAHVRKKPFVPFKLHTTDGRVFDVKEPRGAFVTHIHVTVGTDFDSEIGMYTKSHDIHPSRVDRIEPMPNAAVG